MDSDCGVQVHTSTHRGSGWGGHHGRVGEHAREELAVENHPVCAFRRQTSGFRMGVSHTGLRVQGSEFRVSEFRVQGARVQGSGCQAFRVQGVKSSGFRGV